MFTKNLFIHILIMKDLKKLGTILSKTEQKTINGGIRYGDSTDCAAECEFGGIIDPRTRTCFCL
ncbi:hypothetical protein GCM10022393_30920 [Aquimarina addita]|uniref:Natural product n=2 Tax=Aquimarina addita TaxID=870485 RepID=A0ABP6UNI3_9FLAO